MSVAETSRTPILHRSYSTDYAGWAEDTAQAIEDGRFHDIDRAALADEVRDLSKSERRGLTSALKVLVLHMLKMRYQPEKQTPSWQASISLQRDDVEEYLNESPSLRPDLPRLLEKAYKHARIEAADETGLALNVFPESCEWTATELLEHPADSPAPKRRLVEFD
jgi:hypothetical protein